HWFRHDYGVLVYHAAEIDSEVGVDVPTTKRTEQFTTGDNMTKEVASSVPGATEFDEDDEAVDESWIPLDPRIAAPYVEVIVAGTSFTISKYLLCSRSSFFDRALNGSFREANESKIILDECLDLFLIFHTWLFSLGLDFVETGFRSSDDTGGENRQRVYLEIYIFADRLGIPKLGNAALLQLDKVTRPEGLPSRFGIATIRLAYESVPKSSRLWKYLMAIERDANKCSLPRRAAEDYDHLPGLLAFEVLKLTEEDEKPESQKIDDKSVDLMKLKRLIFTMGGYERVEQSYKWSQICAKMGSRVILGQSSEGNSQKMRNIYRTCLGPFDSRVQPSLERRVREGVYKTAGQELLPVQGGNHAGKKIVLIFRQTLRCVRMADVTSSRSQDRTATTTEIQQQMLESSKLNRGRSGQVVHLYAANSGWQKMDTSRPEARGLDG
ncbi:hypothetical protein E4T39_05169, partial [Aureobasidium subglaciale]